MDSLTIGVIVGVVGYAVFRPIVSRVVDAFWARVFPPEPDPDEWTREAQQGLIDPKDGD